MNTNENQVEPENVQISDPNENKLSQNSSNETINTELSTESQPESVSTNLDSSYDTPADASAVSDTQTDVNTNTDADADAVVPGEQPNNESQLNESETPPISTTIPLQKQQTESKTKKAYHDLLNKSNRTRKHFSKVEKKLDELDKKSKHELRVEISDLLISILRQEKNKSSHKHHTKKLNIMRNLFNGYLNSLTFSKKQKTMKNKSKK